MRFAWPLVLLLAACGTPSGTPDPGPDLLPASATEAPPPAPRADPPPPALPTPPPSIAAEVVPRCPEGMLGIAGGPAELGEADVEGSAKYRPNNVVPRGSFALDGFCIDRFPAPGTEGDPWPRDGIAKKQLREQLEPWLWARGRRLCTVAELMRAAGGPTGARYPWGQEPGTAPCDPDDESPKAMGTYADCVSPEGVRDLQVRSTWARLDPRTLALLTDAGAATQPGFDGGYAVWGGLVRTDTYYAPTNFGVHFHDDEAPAFNDDGLRTCAWPGATADPAGWTAAMTQLRARRSLGALIE